MITKVDIVHMIYSEGDKKIPMKDLDVIVDKVFDVISDELGKGEEVHISGFGSFGLSTTMTKPVVKIKKLVNPKK